MLIEKYPVYALVMRLPSNVLDVNLAADKKQVLVTEEKLLLALIKSSLSASLEVPNRKLEAPLSQSFITDHAVKNAVNSVKTECPASGDVPPKSNVSKPNLPKVSHAEPGRNVDVAAQPAVDEGPNLHHMSLQQHPTGVRYVRFINGEQ